MEKKYNREHRINHPISKIIARINLLGHNSNCHFVILLSIMAYEIMKINLQVIFKEYSCNSGLFDNSWTLASVLGSTVLGFFSDRFFHFSLRKPICLIGILFSILTSIVFLHPSLHNAENKLTILFFIAINGLSGSYLGAVRAFYLDQFPANKVIHFSITVVFQCIPWVIIGWFLTEKIIAVNSLHVIAISLLIIAFLLNLLMVADNRKPQFESRHGAAELRTLAHKYNHVKEWSIILSFFILAVSYQLMPYLGEYAFPNEAFYQEVFLLGIGVGVGVPIAFLFHKLPIIRALKIGYATCFIYFLVIGIFYSLGVLDGGKILKYLFLIFAIFGGTLWILSLKEFLIKSKLTEDGLVLGFIESVQSLGEFVGAGLSTLLSSSIILQTRINVKFFLILLGAAFIMVSLDSLIKSIKNVVFKFFYR